MTTRPSSTSSSSPLGRFLGRALAFMAVLAVLLAGLDRWLAAQVVSAEELRYQAAFQPGDYPQVVFGTSHAANGINPRYLEDGAFRPFNFAFNASSAEFYRHWYAAYRQVHAAPRVILLSVDWVMLRESHGSRKFEHDSEFFPPGLFLSLLASPGMAPDVLVANRFTFIKDRDDLQARLFHQEVWGSYDLGKYYRGFAPYWHKHPQVTPLASFPPIRPEQVRAMDALLATFQRDGARVVLVASPEYHAPTTHDADNAIYVGLARRYGLPFLDYNKALRSGLNDDASLYNDWQHLNERGAERFSRRLHDDLARIGVIGAERSRHASPLSGGR